MGDEVVARGRPSERTPEIEDLILNGLANGKSMVSLCRGEDMPCPSTVYRWLSADKDFCDRYARAREDQADTMADEIIDIADDKSNDTILKSNGDGEPYEVANTEWINRSRLRVDARKWVAAKLKPKKYGDKLTSEISGPNGGPIESRHTFEMDFGKYKVYPTGTDSADVPTE